MFGNIIGKILAAPVRIINLPVQVMSKVADGMSGERWTRPIQDRDPLALEELAKAVERIADDE